MLLEFSVSDKILEQVNEVVYLGNMFSRDGRHEIDAKNHFVSGNKVNSALTAFWVLWQH